MEYFLLFYYTPFVYAAMYNHYYAVYYMLDSPRVDVNVEALKRAIQMANCQIAMEILAHKSLKLSSQEKIKIKFNKVFFKFILMNIINKF